MASPQYWLERLENELYNKTTPQYLKRLKQVYEVAYDSIEQELRLLWIELLDNGYTSIYQCQRWRYLQQQIETVCRQLGITQYDMLQEHLLDVFAHTYETATDNLHGNITLFQPETAKQIVNQNYKGAKFSERIWKNMSKCREQVERSVIETAMKGKDWKKVTKELQGRLDVSRSDAKRIVVTETNRVMNGACLQCAKDNGYEKYEYMAYHDEKTCEECKRLDGQQFLLSQAQVGVNYPPLHPHTRSTVLIVVE